MIGPNDRVSQVLAQDESLIEVFTALSPAFERLRNPGMRRVMSRLVTVAQAARMAGVDAAELVRRLNEGGVMRPEAHTESTSPTSPGPAAQAAAPAALRAIPESRQVHLDVRDDLRNGKEPFSRIMEARRAVPADGALVLRAIFEPVPLYAVLGKQGFAHWTEQLAGDDWRVWFYPAPTADAAAAPVAPAASPDDDGDVRVLDVRGLEPPEPMLRTLAALEVLPDGATLVQLNVRVPQFLLPLLSERGFTYEIREQEPELVRIFIRRRTPE